MDLSTIEILCIAAEITIVLLLIAFAWIVDKEPPKDLSEELTVSWEPAMMAFTQFFIHRGLYLQSRHDLSGDPNDTNPIYPIFVHDGADKLEPMIPGPWQDRLTKLLNRKGLEAILKSWAEVPIQHRSNSCISMFVLGGYSQLISNYGAMTTEQTLRAVAEYLRQKLSNHGLVSRYQSDRFVLLHFSESLGQCHVALEDIQAHITQEGFFTINEQSIPISASVSVVELDEADDLDTQIENLEEGNMIAEENGQAVMSKYQGEWTEEAPEDAAPKHRSAPAPQQHDMEPAAPPQSSSIPAEPESEPELAVPAPEPVNEAPDEEVDDEQLFEDISASHDISAVASAADIEALFAQINNKKKETVNTTVAPANAASPEVPSPTEPQASAAATTPSDVEADPHGAASADDIAALFDAAKKNPSPASEAGSTTLESVDPNEAASADDIAALFAAANKGTSSSSAASAKQPESEPTRSSTTLESVDPNEAASADDIAALFAAANKGTSSSSAAPAKQPVSEPPLNNTTLESADPNEAASADDIAALFAAANNKSSSTSAVPAMQPESEPTRSSTALESVDPNEAASADDIAALFAAANNKPSSSSVADTNKPESATVSSNAKPDSVNPNEAASADDIAALFAAANQSTTAPTETPLTPATESTAKSLDDIDKNEAATADDIASLFATVQSAVASSKVDTDAPVSAFSPNEKGSHRPIQPKDEEAVSSNDIEALFAAFKK